MKNQSLTGLYKKPINIFEAITNKTLAPEGYPQELKNPKLSKDLHASEFLFPIRMLF